MIEHWFDYAGLLLHGGHAYAAYLDDACEGKALHGQRPCPHCGAPMIASTPAAGPQCEPAPTMPPPVKQNQSWRDREPLL